MNKALMIVVFLTVIKTTTAQKTYSITSPNGNIEVKINAGTKLTWSVTSQSQNILAPSAIAMHLQNGQVLGNNAQIISAKKENINATIAALFYKKDMIED